MGDQTCVDSLGSAACRQADVAWNMCSAAGSDPHWTSGCQATCARCSSGLPPCGQCDHKCTNLRSDTDCGMRIQMSAGALCSGGWGAWWLDQCRLACGACDGTLPPLQYTSAVSTSLGCTGLPWVELPRGWSTRASHELMLQTDCTLAGIGGDPSSAWLSLSLR